MRVSNFGCCDSSILHLNNRYSVSLDIEVEVVMKKNSLLKIQKRILVFTGIFITLFVLLGVRIGFIQFVDGHKLSREALEQQTRDRIVSARRGTIYDRNGQKLAVSSNVETISISPKTVRDEGRIYEYAKILSDILEMDTKEIEDKINMKTSYVILKRKVEKEVADKIRGVKIQTDTDKNGDPVYSGLKGVYQDGDTKRNYPYNNIASHIIGFVGTDNQGLLGIEMMYDNTLKGKYGRIVTARNADGTEMPYKHDRYFAPEDGSDITLTIDVTIQHFLEKHLDQAMVDHRLQNGAAAIIMDVRTGEILGMATKPDINLNDPFIISDTRIKSIYDEAETAEEKNKIQTDYLNKVWRNKAVVDSYEPGSTFKIITAAMALEENVATINDTFVCNGFLNVGTHDIKCWKTVGHGTLTFVEAMMNSCNPAFMTIGSRIGPENFYKYYKGFGFTEKANIELSGETSGIFHKMDSFNAVELATCSFGQSFQITPLQMISALSAVANDGKLLKPHVIKTITDHNGNVTKTVDTTEVRQVISAQTAQVLRNIMGVVVSEGTGKKAYLEGFNIGGKTGTSEKIPRGNGKYVASFAGIAPVNDPKVALLLILDEPTGEYMGGTIASPLAGKILDDVLRYMNVEPETTAEQVFEGDAIVPAITEQKIENARNSLSELGLRCIVQGDGQIVTDQVPKAGVTIPKNGTVIIYTGEAKPSNLTTVPNVVGKTFAEAREILENAKLVLSTSGATNPEDKIISQSPTEGQKAEMGTEIEVTFPEKPTE